jgi:CelD/BcsL family acetyltransferase involved in cellulose biosynthesis
MEMTVGWLIDNGVSIYDLLVNPADYKQSWSSRSLVVRCHAEALTWKGQLYVSTWLPAVRPALKRLHAHLPDLRHRMVGFLRGAALLLLYV